MESPREVTDGDVLYRWFLFKSLTGYRTQSNFAKRRCPLALYCPIVSVSFLEKPELLGSKKTFSKKKKKIFGLQHRRAC